MTEPYLILHRVRGEPAFDIAAKLHIGEEEGWIIPTSGHRAYPLRAWPLADIYNHIESSDGRIDELSMIDELHRSDLVMLNSLSDHYAIVKAPYTPSVLGSLAQRLGLVPKAAVITRRI